MKRKIRVSIGSLGVLGLRDIKLPAPPTTLYLMVGERCMYNCAYCPQSQSSHGSTEFLSRVIWPVADWQELKMAIKNTHRAVRRICFQVVNSPNFLEDTLFFVKDTVSVSKLPVSVSVRLTNLDEVKKIFDAGAQRVGLALDVATEKTFEKFRGGNFQNTVSFILNAGRQFPHRITTHIIVGMGETDKELYKIMKNFFNNTITVGLFAFTPVKGTILEKKSPPRLLRYRRIQLMRYLFANNLPFKPQFDEKENLTSIELESADRILKNPEIFITSGCPHCNRPYYNETPTGPMFNFPFAPKKIDSILNEFVEYASKEKVKFKI